MLECVVGVFWVECGVVEGCGCDFFDDDLFEDFVVVVIGFDGLEIGGV